MNRVVTNYRINIAMNEETDIYNVFQIEFYELEGDLYMYVQIRI